jgi:hypothetical protein
MPARKARPRAAAVSEPEPTYTLPEAARRLGMPVRRLRGWLERGLLRGILPAPRRGMDRRVTASDLVRLRALVELQRLMGAPTLRVARRAMSVGRALTDWQPTPQWPTLLVDGMIVFSFMAPRTVVIDVLAPEAVGARLAEVGVAVVVNGREVVRWLERD